MHSTFTLTSFNCKNVKRSVDNIREMCRFSDIIALQETWLLPDEIQYLSTIDRKFSSTGTSAVDTAAGLLRGRPYGGVALLWRSDVFQNVSVIQCNNPRVCAIKIVTNDRPIVVISVYMPTDSPDNLSDFTDCLGTLGPSGEMLNAEKPEGKVGLRFRAKDVENVIRHMSREVATARGRLKGALMDVLEPAADDSDASSDNNTEKRESHEPKSEDEDKSYRRKWSPNRQSYVLKLFDRSVDLSQFKEDTPLYPICRAWIANQPRANYREFGKKQAPPLVCLDSVELPVPEGSSVSKIPPLLPEQLKASKNNINLNYREAPPPSREQLLASHSARWQNVRQAWLYQAAKVEAQYDATQQILNKINVNAI